MTATMRALGAILVVVGTVIAARSALLLRGYGRPRRGPQPRFVIAGPYRRTRNPCLAGLLLAMAGAACASRSTPLAVATVIAAAVAHAWVVRVEEPTLAARFGDAYEAYRRCVPRWLPRGSGLRDADPGSAG